MNWEQLTAAEFADARRRTDGFCVLPIGCIEKHADHLPLGQDLLYVHEVCTRAARQEPAVVFPPYYFSQILEAQHVPGTIALKPDLLIALLQNVCNEIGRNGFSKILIVNGHGGNMSMLRYFLQTQLATGRDYCLYLSDIDYPAPKTAAAKESTVDGHAGEKETSSLMFLFPELVHPDQFGEYGVPLRRISDLLEHHITTPIWWYADYPGHFAGERVPVSRQKGEVFVAEHLEVLVSQFRAIKRDTTVPALTREFYQRASAPDNRYP